MTFFGVHHHCLSIRYKNGYVFTRLSIAAAAAQDICGCWAWWFVKQNIGNFKLYSVNS